MAVDPDLKSLAVAIRDQSVLYAAYMPFLKNGGLFIPTRKPFNMGEKCNLKITLPHVEKPYELKCKVVWITPRGAQGNRVPGVGLEFSETIDGEMLRRKIEEILGTLLQGGGGTHTM